MSKETSVICKNAFPHQVEIPTRFGDNDMLGHVNNVAFNRYFEVVAVDFQTRVAGIKWTQEGIVPMAVETLCRFHKQLSFPETVTGCLRVNKIGRSSVIFGIALYGEGASEPAATGHFVHVFSDVKAGSSVPIPESVRAIYQAYLVP